ncbi:Uncharacterized protein Fot_52639 [Forsythia ovata]|uniref:Uncharacterized protein n=1 Tax=Forsythia ovata TaxID=205694 RepID=A0ABD1PLB7_9LAMI
MGFTSCQIVNYYTSSQEKAGNVEPLITYNSCYLATHPNGIIHFHLQRHENTCKLFNYLCCSENIDQDSLSSLVISILRQCFFYIMDYSIWASDLTASIDLSVLQERLTNMINLG